jgi:hypothetical protein
VPMTEPDLDAVYERTFTRPAFTTRAGVSAVVSGQMTAYFSSIDGNEDGLVKAYRHVKDAIGRHMTWYRTETIRRSRAIAAKDLEAIETWFGSPLGQRDEYELVLGSGEKPGEIGPWAFRFAVDRTTLPDVLGYFQFSVPATFARQQPQAFKALAQSVFGAADFVSAYAGLGITFDPGDIDPERDQIIRGLCSRFLGLDCSDVLSETEALGNAIKGVNWLTFVGRKLAERVGGAEAVASAVGDRANVEAMGAHGFMVQAGDAPILGDRHNQENVDAYRAADDALREIRVEQLYPLPGFEDEIETAAWLRRFEATD